MKKILSHFTILIFCGSIATAQVWQAVPENSVNKKNGILNYVNDYQEFYLQDAETIKQQLKNAPKDPNRAITLQFPNPEGTPNSFKVWEASVMEPGLAEKYPELRQYTAEKVGAPWITAKIDLNPQGIRAMIFDGANTYFVEPAAAEDNNYYAVFYKKNIVGLPKRSCDFDGNTISEEPLTPAPAVRMRTHGAQRRNYRLALAATGEYTAYFGSQSNAINAIVTTMNRVNGVYERELSVHMTLVANNNNLVYTNASTDPYTNNDGIAMLSENKTNLTNVIGTANYDIGHVFSTGGGGIAALGSVCGTNKAMGVTGSPWPVGDAYDIDYVCHEMGHQFGGNHTFNGTTGDGACNGNRNPTTAYEPGSGSTIMAYAGICGVENLQPHSDAYFHAVSLKEMATFITTGNGNTCGTGTASTNVPNIIPSFNTTYNIPYKTPFELTAPVATDATTSQAITYCWEEYDLGPAAPPNNDADGNKRPILRSFYPDTSRTRSFPSKNKIMANDLYSLGETLPQITRTLSFILTTRDFYQGWGAFNSTYDSDSIKLFVQNTGSTFDVSSQNTATTWAENSTQTITWSVAGTASAPINASSVSIYLSVDSAATFPYVLASGVTNSGTANISVPDLPAATNKARIKVKADNNVFFQLNKANISITNNVLPIDLVSFNAGIENCVVHLNWSVANAINFKQFAIEKSSDGSVFTEIKKIDYLPAQNNYQFSERNTSNDAVFYRIKLIDQDGSAKFSNVKKIHSNEVCSDKDLTIFPNPATKTVTIKAFKPMKMIRLISTDGRVVKEYRTKDNTFNMDLAQQAAGVYIVEVVYEDNTVGRSNIVK